MNPMMQQKQGPAPQQGAEPEQEMEMEMPAEGMEAPEIDGEELQMLMFSRVAQLSEPELQVLDSIITPQTVPVLFKLFPELGILFDKGSQLQGAVQQQGPAPAAAAGGQPPQAMPAPQAQARPQQPPEDEERNPLVSRGLTGY